MGVSRSAATVIAYAMKEYGWDLNKAFDYVKERRAVTKPNPSFMRQLEEYQGILMARYTHKHKGFDTILLFDLLQHSLLRITKSVTVSSALKKKLSYFKMFIGGVQN